MLTTLLATTLLAHLQDPTTPGLRAGPLPNGGGIPRQILVNGQPLLRNGIIYRNHVLVPMRALFERLGAQVRWQRETQRVFATRGGKTVTLDLANKAEGGESPMLVEGITMVPLRYVGETLGATVRWDPAARTVTIDLRS